MGLESHAHLVGEIEGTLSRMDGSPGSQELANRLLTHAANLRSAIGNADTGVRAKHLLAQLTSHTGNSSETRNRRIVTARALREALAKL